MKYLEKFLSTAIYVIMVSMFVYIFTTGLAIAHFGDIHECPICAYAEDTIRWFCYTKGSINHLLHEKAESGYFCLILFVWHAKCSLSDKVNIVAVNIDLWMVSKGLRYPRLCELFKPLQVDIHHIMVCSFLVKNQKSKCLLICLSIVTRE